MENQSGMDRMSNQGMDRMGSQKMDRMHNQGMDRVISHWMSRSTRTTMEGAIDAERKDIGPRNAKESTIRIVVVVKDVVISQRTALNQGCRTGSAFVAGRRDIGRGTAICHTFPFAIDAGRKGMWCWNVISRIHGHSREHAIDVEKRGIGPDNAINHPTESRPTPKTPRRMEEEQEDSTEILKSIG